MIYGVCLHCSHTQDLPKGWVVGTGPVFFRCYSCGCGRWFRVVRQIEQPDGSVVEVAA